MSRRYDAVLFDAGNTLVYLDHSRVAELAGGGVTPEQVYRGEREARRDADGLTRRGLGHLALWRRYMEITLAVAGLSPEIRDRAVERVLQGHLRWNLWRHVPEDVAPTLVALRDQGYTLGVISNAEGTVAQLLRDVGLAGFFRFIIDSHVVGVEKPDPRIFALGLEQAGTAPDRTLYIGDLYQVDVAGARRAGLDAVLLDCFNLHPELTCPRVGSLRELLEHVDG